MKCPVLPRCLTSPKATLPVSKKHDYWWEKNWAKNAGNFPPG